MKYISILITVLFLVFSFSGCATANVSKSREAFILSQPHGWVSITLIDVDIPSFVGVDDNGEQYEIKASRCSLTATINSELFLHETVFPVGDEKPFSIDTGFRFAAPVGTFEVGINYHGCDVDENGDMTKISFNKSITIIENMVIPINFNGTTFEIDKPEKNEVITLDDIYQKLETLE